METSFPEVCRALEELCDGTPIQFAVEDIGAAMNTIRFGRAGDEPLTVRERAVFATCRALKRQSEWLAGRRAAKRVLCAMFALRDPTTAEVGRRDTGAPVVTGHEGVVVSISHSSTVAVAVAARFPVGVDVELDEQRPECLWDAVLCAAERQTLARSRDDERHRAGNRLWTSKEAVSKVGGWGA